MAKKVVTLYIDDNSIRLLVARGKQVKKWASLPLEAGLVRDGIVLDKAMLAARIRELFKNQKVETKKIIAGLSGLNCLSRVVTLPQLSKAALAEAVRQEAERALPVPLEQLYLSWQIISLSGEFIQVFLAALPRNAADAVIETLRLAGIKPHIIDLKPLALTRVLREDTAIIVDVQAAEYDIIVMVKGIPVLIRSLSFSNAALSLQDKCPAIREELERTTKFYKSSYPKEPLEPGLSVFASGELADEPGLCRSLSEKLGYPITPLISPLKCPRGFVPSQYMVNIGLALKEVLLGKRAGPAQVNLNAMPEVYRPKAPSLTRILVPTGTILAIGLLIPLATHIQSVVASTVSMQGQLDTANFLWQQRQIKQQTQRSEIADLEEEVVSLEGDYNIFATALDSINARQEMVNSDLKLVTSRLPNSINLRNITHADDEMAISGTSTDETEVLAYADALRASGRFFQVVVSGMDKTEDGMSFTLLLMRKGNG